MAFKGGYPELDCFVMLSILIKNREWLLKNTPHLLALIKASEGKGCVNVVENKIPVLYKVALAADGEVFRWKILRIDKLMAGIAQKIKFTKDKIEEANNDVHRWGFE